MLCAVPQRRVLDAEAGTVVWPQRCVDVSLSELAPVLRGLRVVESTTPEGARAWRITWDESDAAPGLSLLYEIPNLAITDDLRRTPRAIQTEAKGDASDGATEQMVVAFGEFPRGEVSAASYPLDLALDLQVAAGLGADEQTRLVAAHALMGRTTPRAVARVTCLATPAHVRRWTSFLSAFASSTAVCLVLTGVRDAKHAEELLQAATRDTERHRTWLRLHVSVVLSILEDAPRVSAAELEVWVDRYGLAGLGVTHCADPCACAAAPPAAVGGQATCCVSGHCK